MQSGNQIVYSKNTQRVDTCCLNCGCHVKASEYPVALGPRPVGAAGEITQRQFIDGSRQRSFDSLSGNLSYVSQSSKTSLLSARLLI
jgi:hypothetical protein